MALGLLVLPAVDWAYVRAQLTHPVDSWWKLHRWERREKAGPLVFAGLLITLGVTLCLEFPGDNQARRKPWEDQSPDPEGGGKTT